MIPSRTRPACSGVLSKLMPMTYSIDLARNIFYAGKPEYAFTVLHPFWLDLAITVAVFVVFIVVGTVDVRPPRPQPLIRRPDIPRRGRQSRMSRRARRSVPGSPAASTPSSCGRSRSSGCATRSPRTRATSTAWSRRSRPTACTRSCRPASAGRATTAPGPSTRSCSRRFPDNRFSLTDIVVGPQGVFEAAELTGTNLGPWAGVPASGLPVSLQVLILFPWNPAARAVRRRADLVRPGVDRATAVTGLVLAGREDGAMNPIPPLPPRRLDPRAARRGLRPGHVTSPDVAPPSRPRPRPRRSAVRPSLGPPTAEPPAAGDLRHGPRGGRRVRAADRASRPRRRPPRRHDRGHRRGALRARPPQQRGGCSRRFGRTDVPVACGRENPGPNGRWFPPEWRAGADALYGVELPAVEGETARGETAPELLVRLAAESPEPLTLLTVGPFSNVADAAALDPSFASRLAGIHAMAGTIDAPGNIEYGGDLGRGRRRVERRRRPRRAGRGARARRAHHARRPRRDQRRPGAGRHRLDSSASTTRPPARTSPTRCTPRRRSSPRPATPTGTRWPRSRSPTRRSPAGRT